MPKGSEGEFSLKPSPPDLFSGNYDSPDNYMFLQLAGADNLNFTIGNDWCGMNGAAKITGKTAHYEKMMKGVLIHLNFDFSKPGKCIVESNINSPEAQEQGIKELLGNVIRCEPNFSGEYRLHTEASTIQENKELEAARSSALTATPIPPDSDDNEYCTNMSDEAKSKRLDQVEGVTITAPGPIQRCSCIKTSTAQPITGAPGGIAVSGWRTTAGTPWALWSRLGAGKT